MADNLGTAVLELEADASRLKKDLDRTDRDAEQSGERSSSKFGGSFGKGLKKAMVPALAVLGGAVVGFKRVTDSATNLGESVNAVNVVFGDAADKVLAFGKVAAREAGLSMRAFNELVTPIGAALQNVGFSADQAATASINLGKRAADMASVFNVDVSEALGAIQAGLRGEADPLERFGVGLSDVAVKAKAMEMGLAKTEKELTANDKAQARLALVMEQTNKLQGDFVNTSGEAANAARVNAAEQENLEAKIGTGLLPIVKMYQKALASVTAFMGEHTGVVKIGSAVLVGLAVTVLAVNAAMKVATAATALSSVAFIGLGTSATIADKMMRLTLIGALISLGIAIVIAYQKSETFRNVVSAAFHAVESAVKGATSWILGGIARFLEGIEGMVRAMSKLPGIGGKFKGLADQVGTAADKVRNLQAEINGLRSKEITITTTLRTISRVEEGSQPHFGGGRQLGGPVYPRASYLVGERGPELFVPDAAGRIVSNADLGEGAGNARPLFGEVHVHGDVDIELLAKRVQRVIALGS